MSEQARTKIDTMGQVFRWITPLLIAIIGVLAGRQLDVIYDQQVTAAEDRMHLEIKFDAKMRLLNTIGTNLAEQKIILQNISGEVERNEDTIDEHQVRLRHLEIESAKKGSQP